MKKIILSMLVLAGATTYAQVGINEESPKATLDIKAKSLNTEDNLEGLLIPRVSKNKAFKMTEFTDATDPTKTLTESTMIYVNDLTDYTTSPVDTKVADITENGFYFWNGTKWVRQTGQDGEEWVYDPATKQINLKRSGQGDFHNYVYYDNTTGQYVNTDTFENIETLIEGIPTVKSLFEISKAKRISFVNSANIPVNNNDDGSTVKLGDYDIVQVTSQENSNSIVNQVSNVHITSDNSNDYKSVSANTSTASLYGTGTVGYPTGFSAGLSVGNQQNISGFSSAVAGTASTRGNGDIDRFYGVMGRNLFYETTGGTISYATSGFFQSSMYSKDNNTLIKNHTGISNTVNNTSKNAGAGVRITGLFNSVVQNGNTKYGGMYGIYTGTRVGDNAIKPKKLYGIYVEDATGAELENYAIFTNEGRLRFGDLEGAGDRIVIAKETGVLSTTTASVDDFVSLWKKETTNNSIILKVNSAGADRISTAGTTRNDVAITDEGKILARGFIGYNGASIFPDYVFEKYYKGYSDIKADYNFHNLASIESFVKKNGHLPGYKSAKEIAKEGLIDISATQLTNIEKIEELYLHTIEQERKIEAQQKQIDELKALVNQLINK